MRRAVTRTARAALVAVTALAVATPAFGLFQETATSSTGTFSTAALAPATDLAVAWSCPSRPEDKTGYTATITWTASTSDFVTGYEVGVAPDEGGPWTVILITTDTAATETGVAHRTERWYSVTALAQTWRSAPSVIATRAPNPQC